MSSPNALLDWVRALHLLSPEDEEARVGIASALGMQLRAVSPSVEPGGRDATRKPAGPLQPPRPTRPSERDEETPVRREPLPSELIALESAVPGPPDWLQTVPHLAEVDAATIQSPLPYEPLLRREWTRAILSGAVATPGMSGEIDLTHAINNIARAEPVEVVPRRGAPTLARGVQLLVDISVTMQPFAADQAAVCAAIVRVVGRDKSQVLRFTGCPLWGAGNGLPDEWSSYMPPVPGTPILALTDIGIGHPVAPSEQSRPEDWVAVAEIARRAGCALVALVPYEPARWPAELQRHLTIVQWDRTTTAATVTRLVGRALSRPPAFMR